MNKLHTRSSELMKQNFACSNLQSVHGGSLSQVQHVCTCTQSWSHGQDPEKITSFSTCMSCQDYSQVRLLTLAPHNAKSFV